VHLKSKTCISYIAKVLGCSRTTIHVGLKEL
jgi:predicted transcriptional regulator YheO